MLKVMFVDDEILAIQHITHLIDWESHGFQIACHSTSPRRALQLAAEHMPDIIFVDIKMPVMDGLVFSQQLFESGYKGKILLLTSVKQFEYAKEALKLGISNYLVKHELNGETLLHELISIRTELEQEHEQHELVVRQLFSDLLLGEPLKRNRLSLLHQLAPAGSLYYVVLFQRERPFPVLGGDQTRYAAPVGQDLELIRTLGNKIGESTLIASIPVRNERVCVFFACERSKSEHLVWQRQHETVSVIISAFAGSTVNTVISSASVVVEQLAASFREADDALNKAVFWHKQTMMLQSNMNRLYSPKPLQISDDSSYTKQILSSLSSRDSDKAITSLRAWFVDIEHSLSVQLLIEACSRLSAMLNGYLNEHKLPPLSDENNNQWLNVRTISHWFEDKLRAALEASQPMPAYSRKVQQAMNYMEAHYAKEMTAETIAEQLQLSADHLRHLFKEETGQTLLDTLTAVRIGHAKRLLAEGNYKIYEIADKTGYRSAQYFSQVFRKQTGLTPNEYADRYQSD